MVLIAALALLGACSSDRSHTISPVTTSSSPAETVATTAPPTDAPTTAVPTTAPPATVAPTSVPLVAAGWAPLAQDQMASEAWPPCCASNWNGEPSPTLPAAGQPLTDGVYYARVTWGDDASQPLQLTVERFVQCADPLAMYCEEPMTTFGPTELGLDESAPLSLTVPLDEHVRVVLVGFYGYDADYNVINPIAEGNGADLAALAVAVDQAYATVLAARLAGGETPDAIIADLAAHPTAGWGPGADGMASSLSFTYLDAPPLLFQGPFHYDPDLGTAGPATAGRGTDVLRVTALEVAGGVTTVYVYAGYYS